MTHDPTGRARVAVAAGGVHEYFPVHFDELHLTLCNVTLHAALLGHSPYLHSSDGGGGGGARHSGGGGHRDSASSGGSGGGGGHRDSASSAASAGSGGGGGVGGGGGSMFPALGCGADLGCGGGGGGGVVSPMKSAGAAARDGVTSDSTSPGGGRGGRGGRVPLVAALQAGPHPTAGPTFLISLTYPPQSGTRVPLSASLARVYGLSHQLNLHEH